MKIASLFIAIVMAGTTTILAQDSKGVPPPKELPKAESPKIPDALRAKFFKAQVEVMTAQKNLDQKNQAIQTIIAEINGACGDKFVPTLDNGGDLQCVAKPEPAKADPKPETKK